jgi:hypothetical protein
MPKLRTNQTWRCATGTGKRDRDTAGFHDSKRTPTVKGNALPPVPGRTDSDPGDLVLTQLSPGREKRSQGRGHNGAPDHCGPGHRG